MNIVKKLFKNFFKIVIFLVIIALIVVTKFYPQLLQQEPFLSWQKNFSDKTSQVLGAKTTDLWQKYAPQLVNYVVSSPLVNDIKSGVESKVEHEIQSIKEKPQQEIVKMKNDVRETVCEDWLADDNQDDQN